jgi:hypothetical protein
MIMRPLGFVLSAFLAISAPAFAAPSEPPPYEQTLSPDEMRGDLALLRQALETIHPGLYRYTSRAEIDAAFARLEAAAGRPLPVLELHHEIAILLAAIHCDHTKPELPEAVAAWRNTNPSHLPFRFRLIEGRMIVISRDGQVGAPPVGAEILTINGRPAPLVLKALAPTVAYDGDTDQAVAVKLADDSDLSGSGFDESYPGIFGMPSQWTLDWKSPGAAEARRAVLAPISFQAWTGLPAPGGAYRSEFYNGVTWRMAGKAARLRIDTFVNYRNPVQPTAFLGGFFRAMAAAGTEHLILDLRGNGGGSEDVSIALGRYLIDRPFIWSKPAWLKAIRYGDLPTHIDSWGDREALFNPPEDRFDRFDGGFARRPNPTADERDDSISDIIHLPAPEAERFTGRLTVLIGPQNGSGATRTVAQLKARRATTLVGEDTSGSAEGPTAGQIFLLTLPASGIKVRVPNAWNRTNIDRFTPRLGVAADIRVTPTLADFQADRDRALEVARDLPGSTTTAATPADLAAAMAGNWAGVLEYRDYRSNRRVVLPAKLVSDGQSLDWTFDDGPGKTVRADEAWSLQPDLARLSIREGAEVRTWTVSEFRSAANGAVTVVLDGKVIENGREVIARQILTREGARLRLSLMTRAPGEPFLLRRAYELARSIKSES